MKNLILCMSILVLAALPVAADGVDVLPVEMASGFETSTGKLVIAGNQLVFLDDSSPQYSFVVTRNQVGDLRETNGTLVIVLTEPIRDRQGQKTSLSFRYGVGTSPQSAIDWFNSSASRASSAPQTPMATRAAQSGDMMYDVRHKRMFGDTNGKLTMTDSLISYESTDKIEDSRNWSLREVKEVKLKNPYELQIIPFTGDKYDFVVKGTPITGDDFKAITDRVVNARVQSSR